MKKYLLFLFFISGMQAFPFSDIACAGDPRWQASIPGVAQTLDNWERLITDLKKNKLYYGAVAASAHLISFFQDLAAKELAYKTAIEIIDEGYPVQIRDIFIPGDLDPPAVSAQDSKSENYGFVNSYYLYKAMLNEDRNLQHWSDYYMNQVDKEHFPKYFLFSALDAYGKGDLNSAIDLLKKALSLPLDGQPPSLVSKITRTLARIYFEQGQYQKSLDIYRSFLLKLTPLVQTDWVEAAWAEFHLKHYEESLGLLYNLQSRSAGNELYIEKYNLRALIYRATCSTTHMEKLQQSFDRAFATTISGIKHGASLKNFPILQKLNLPENADYNQTLATIDGLNGELLRIKILPKNDEALAHYLYGSELKMLRQKLKAHAPAALERAASQILTLAEQMRFLKFDIERSRYNPDLVFKPVGDELTTKPVVKAANSGDPNDQDDQKVEVHWKQFGDYWFDERNNYKGVLPNQCGG